MTTGRNKKLRRSVYFHILDQVGFVPCYVCGNPVSEKSATLEHVIPRSKGGRHSHDNFSISHKKCNNKRGSRDIEPKGIVPDRLYDGSRRG